MSGHDIELFITGIGEGFFAPLVEGLLASIIIEMGEAFQPITVSSAVPFTFSDLLLWFAIMIFIEHLACGFIGRMSMALGYLFGAIFAIIVYAGFANNILPSIAQEAWSIIVVIMLGLIIRFIIAYLIEKSEREKYYRNSYW